MQHLVYTHLKIKFFISQQERVNEVVQELPTQMVFSYDALILIFRGFTTGFYCTCVCPNKIEIVVKTYLVFICGWALPPLSSPPLPLRLSVSLCDIASDEPVRDRFDHSGVVWPTFPRKTRESWAVGNCFEKKIYFGKFTENVDQTEVHRSRCLLVNKHLIGPMSV